MNTGRALSFRGIQSRLNTSEFQHGDLADQAIGQMGDVEIVEAVENMRRDESIEENIFERRRLMGEQDNCVSCHEAISEARRKALPKTVYCRDCQEEREEGLRL